MAITLKNKKTGKVLVLKRKVYPASRPYQKVKNLASAKKTKKLA